MFKQYLNILPSLIQELFTINSTQHNYNTRQHTHIQVHTQMSIHYLVFMTLIYEIICLMESHLMYHMLTIENDLKKYIKENDIPYCIT